VPLTWCGNGAGASQRARIGRVEAFGDGEHVAGVIRRKGEDRDDIKRAAGWNDAGCADETARRLQTDDVIELGGNAARARRVGA
jgi:hypothetical protein